jgi:hypothetical protein
MVNHKTRIHKIEKENTFNGFYFPVSNCKKKGKFIKYWNTMTWYDRVGNTYLIYSWSIL